jgi:hypothetical protein
MKKVKGLTKLLNDAKKLAALSEKVRQEMPVFSELDKAKEILAIGDVLDTIEVLSLDVATCERYLENPKVKGE